MRPWVSAGAIAVIVVAWVIALVRGADPWAPSAESLIASGASGGEVARGGWRLVTAWTAHAGAVHLGFNICILMCVGPGLERRAGHAITALTILGGAVAAAAVSRWASPYVLTVGASGAAFALATGLVVRLIRDRGKPGAKRWAIAGLVVFALTNVVALVVAPAVDHAAHLGGAVAGGVIGAVIELRRVGPAVAIAAVVAISVAAAVAAPVPRDVGPTLRAVDAIEARYRDLIARRAGGPPIDRAADAALAAAIRDQVAAPLAALAGRLGDDPAMPGRLRGRLAAARRYLAARQDGLELYVQYLETGDTTLRNRIVEADHAVDAALELLAR